MKVLLENENIKDDNLNSNSDTSAESTYFDLVETDVVGRIGMYAGSREFNVVYHERLEAYSLKQFDHAQNFYKPNKNFNDRSSVEQKLFYTFNKQRFIEKYGKEWLPPNSLTANYETDMVKDYASLSLALELFLTDLELVLGKMMGARKLTPEDKNVKAIRYTPDWKHKIIFLNKQPITYQNISILVHYYKKTQLEVEAGIKATWRAYLQFDTVNLLVSKMLEISMYDEEDRDFNTENQLVNLLSFVQLMDQAKNKTWMLERYHLKFKDDFLQFIPVDRKFRDLLLKLLLVNFDPEFFNPTFPRVTEAILEDFIRKKSSVKSLQPVLELMQKFESQTYYCFPLPNKKLNMSIAVRNGDLDMVKFLYEKFPINLNYILEQDRTGKFAVEIRAKSLTMLAAQHNHLEVLRFLIANGADPLTKTDCKLNYFRADKKFQCDENALVFASKYSNIDTLEELLTFKSWQPDEVTLNVCTDNALEAVQLTDQSRKDRIQILALFLALLPNMDHPVMRDFFIKYDLFEKKKLPERQVIAHKECLSFFKYYAEHYKPLVKMVSDNFPEFTDNWSARGFRLFGIFNTVNNLKGKEEATQFKQRLERIVNKNPELNLKKGDVVALEKIYNETKDATETEYLGEFVDQSQCSIS